MSGILDVAMKIANGWFIDKRILPAYHILPLSMLFSGTAALLCAIISGLEGNTYISLLFVTCSLFGQVSLKMQMRLHIMLSNGDTSFIQ